MDTTSDVSRSRTSVKGTSWVTPARFFFAPFTIEAVLYASEQYQWFAFNRHKNWTVLITIAVVAGAIVLMAGWFGIRLLLRKSVQFDLAALLMLIATISIPFAWFTDAKQRVEKERLATEWIEHLDGGIYYDTHTGHGIFRRANGVGVGCSAHRDRSLPSLRKWLGDAFLDKGMRRIEIGDRFPYEPPYAYGEVPQQPKSYFDYYDPQYDVTNGELVHLPRFYDLEQLGICSRKISDVGLRSLYGMRRLNKLSLVTPNVTPGAVAELRRNLPHCEIVQYGDVTIPAEPELELEEDETIDLKSSP